MQSCSQIITSNKPTSSFFLQTGCPPVAQPTVSKHWREKYHILWTCLLQTRLGVFKLCLWPLIAPGYVGRFTMSLISPLMPVPLVAWHCPNKTSYWITLTLLLLVILKCALLCIKTLKCHGIKFNLHGTTVVAELPELKKVVVVPYIKSDGEDAAIGNIKNGLVANSSFFNM